MNDFQNIINSETCIACGACTKISNAKLKINKLTGFFEPYDYENKFSKKYCPSIKVDYETLKILN